MGKRVCPVCDGKYSDFIRTINMKVPKHYRLPEYYNVTACRTCGMVYADTEASLEDYDWYYSHCNFYGDASKDDNSLRYEMVKEILEQFCKKDSVMLDIGAGNGKFEVALRKNGYRNVTGIDPSLESVERLEEAGIHSWVGNIYSPVSREERHKYDCVFLFEVAEHLLNPEKGIRNVKELMKEEGVFVVSVPDYSQIKKENQWPLPHYFNLEHINYFSETSLDNLMGRYRLQRIFQKRAGEDLIQCYKNVDVPTELKRDVVTQEKVCEYFTARQGMEEKITHVIANLKGTQREIAIWGTGSYMMNLVAETDLLKCNIKGFIDNNKIIQGREMYGHPIYAPEFLQDKNYMVLICSMLNGQDIQAQLKEMCTENDCIIL